MAKHCLLDRLRCLGHLPRGYGCRVIQRLIEYCASVQISALLDEVLQCCASLGGRSSVPTLSPARSKIELTLLHIYIRYINIYIFIYGSIPCLLSF